MFGATRHVGHKWSFVVLQEGKLVNGKPVCSTYDEAVSAMRTAYPGTIQISHKKLMTIYRETKKGKDNASEDR